MFGASTSIQNGVRMILLPENNPKEKKKKKKRKPHKIHDTVFKMLDEARKDGIPEKQGTKC